MDAIYCSEQIEVPNELPGILKAFTKEVIRYNPADVIAFSKDYFSALCDGKMDEFLDDAMAKSVNFQFQAEAPLYEQFAEGRVAGVAVQDIVNRTEKPDKAGEQNAAAAVKPRQDPPHEFYGSWDAVEKVKAEYLSKEAYEIDVNGVKIKLHHNSAGVDSHTSCMANHLTEDLYNKLKDRVTPNGVTLDKCIKTGIENPGHPAIKTVGMTAGDVESYEVFKELFDPVIDERHGGYGPDSKHPSDMDASKIKDPSVIDENYVISTRVRSGRSVQGIPLPPSCNKEERRKLEEIVTKALTKLEGELAGDYFPLAGSQSYAAKPGGMTAEEEEKLRTDHFLFQEPDSTLLISGAMHRDWPDARGIYHNKDKNALVWLNEEDHLRIISMQMGPDIKAVFTRFASLCSEVEKVVTAEGFSFAHSEHLGYILTCPSNLGTGLRASMMVKLPNLGKHPDFKKMAGDLGIQIRGSAGVDSGFTGVFDLSNSARLGKSEVELINIMIDGVAALINKEKELEAAAAAAPAEESKGEEEKPAE